MKKNKLHYSGFWRRLSASLVDILITMLVLTSLMYLLGLDKYLAVELDDNIYSLVENKQANINRVIIDIVSIIIVSAYYIYFVASKRKATIGKMLFGICVVDIHGKKLTKMRALARFLASATLVSLTFGIALIMVVFTKEKTALYVLDSSTLVSLTFGIALIMVAFIVPLLTLGIPLIMVAFTKEKTALHDLICGTRVIRKTYKQDQDE